MNSEQDWQWLPLESASLYENAEPLACLACTPIMKACNLLSGENQFKEKWSVLPSPSSVVSLLNTEHSEHAEPFFSFRCLSASPVPESPRRLLLPFPGAPHSSWGRFSPRMVI